MEPFIDQPDFLALGFAGDTLSGLIHRSFEAQDQGLSNAYGFDMISPYIDASGARLVRLMRSDDATVAVSFIHPGVAAARVGVIADTRALVDILTPTGEIAARVVCTVDDFFTYPSLTKPELVTNGTLATEPGEEGMMQVENFCMTAAMMPNMLHLFPHEESWRLAHPQHVREDGVITQPRLISYGAQEFFDGETPEEISPWSLVRLTVAGWRTAKNELTGLEFLVVQDTPNARGYALTACLPASDELKKYLKEGVVLEGPALLMGHNAS